MTLKVRLAMMMVLLLITAMAIQYVLAEREQRALITRLTHISSDVEDISRLLSEGMWDVAATGAPASIENVLDWIASDSLCSRILGNARLEMVELQGAIAAPDSCRVVRLSEPSGAPPGQMKLHTMLVAHDTAGAPGLPAGGGPWRSIRREIAVAGRPDSLGHGSLIFEVGFDSLCDAAAVAGLVGESITSVDRAGAFVVNLPLTSAGMGGRYGLQVLHPFDDIVGELDRSRRRSRWWLAALIGIGTIGATVIAAQFTRPIHTLHDSIHQVEAGDLELDLRPQRPDEIGRLTVSFNQMVNRLKEGRALERRLAEAERLAALGRLAAGVAHEVRNPLNAILLAMQQMRDKLAVGEADVAASDRRRDFDKYYGIVTGELGRLDGMVSSFLELSRSGNLMIENVDLFDSLRTSAVLFQSDAEARQIELRIEGEAPVRIPADPSRLPTIWNNLLSNALAATGPGGRVIVGATQVADEVQVTITDSGGGMPVDQLERIWEPFYSDRPGGTGLGLSIVRSVVEQHGGRVAASSEIGQGTRVDIWLPVHQQKESR